APACSPRWVCVVGATYSTCTVRRFASFGVLAAAAAASSASMLPCFEANPPTVDDAPPDFGFVASRTEALLVIPVGAAASSSAGTVVFWISMGVVVLLVMTLTTFAYSLSQLWRATSKRSARFRGLGTSIRRRGSRAWGDTYSGNVSGV